MCSSFFFFYFFFSKDSGSDVDLHWASGYNRTIITLPEQENDGQVWSVG